MVKYIYVCSAARSGSTLLDMLLGGNSRIASLGEFSYLGKAIALGQACSCGSLICECESWKRVLAKVNADKGVDLCQEPYALRQWDTRAGVIIDKNQQTKLYVMASTFRSILFKLRYILPFLHLRVPAVLREGIKNTVYLYDTIISEWSVSAIVDSTKNYNQALALYENKPDDTKVILLVRDGRGVFSSRLRSGFSRKESLKGWLNTNSRALRFLKPNIDDHSLKIVKYEDLVLEPEKTLRDLCGWAGIEFDPNMVDLSYGERHLVNGNNTMYKRNKGISLDERWKSELSEEDLDWFIKRAGKLNQELGYD